MDMTKIGGDSQNTMPIAINSGLAARKIVQASAPADAKLSVDAFKSSLQNGGANKIMAGIQDNLPIADALQQQSGMVRLASKIPFVRNWLGNEGQMNGIIGTLNDGKGGFLSNMIPGMGTNGPAIANMSKVELTRALYNAKTPQEIQQIVSKAGIADKSVAKQLIDSATARLSGTAADAATAAGESGAKTLVTDAAQTGAKITATDIATEAAGLTLKKGVTSAPTQEAIMKALQSANPEQALRSLGFYAKDAKGLVAKMTQTTTNAVETTVKDGATKVAQTTTTTTTTEVAQKSSSGIKGFFGKLFGGAKGNFIIAGIFSLASNTIQLAQGKMNLKQWAGLTLMDTAAYGAIGWGSAAAGGAIAQALIPIPGVGFAIGLGLGFLGGWLYEKFLRKPVKNMLGGPVGGAAPNSPSAYNPNQTAAAPADPYAGQPAVAPSIPAPGTVTSFDQAMAAINQMGHS